MFLVLWLACLGDFKTFDQYIVINKNMNFTSYSSKGKAPV